MNRPDFNEHFDRMFATSKQKDFEAWFADLCACVWGNDFEPIKAGGQHGDKKSDDRRISTETVFQCYAPESPATFAAKAVAKIQDSFPDVLQYWPNLAEWVFIHNNVEGITSAVSDTLEDLRSKYPNVKISSASRRYLKDLLHDRLTVSQMLDIYPMARLNFKAVEMEHVRPLLKRIIRDKTTTPDLVDFGGIPDEKKLDYNDLSYDSKLYLKTAFLHIGIVDRYLEAMSVPSNASDLQAEMWAKYLGLKDLGYDPDEILGKLVSFVRGVEDDPKTMAAAYVVVAYYFDACDVFENVPEGIAC